MKLNDNQRENLKTYQIENNKVSENEEIHLRKNIKKLAKMQRSVVVLRVFQELPFKNIGNILGITENSAKVNYYKAKENLKKWMKVWIYE